MTSLCFVPSQTMLVCGDAEGSLRCWVRQQRNGWTRHKLLQLVVGPVESYGSSSSTGVAIVGLERIQQSEAVVAVATMAIEVDFNLPPGRLVPSQVHAFVSIAKAGVVAVVDVVRDSVLVSLDGHVGAVRVMVSCPNGEFVTAGGKSDATLKVWSIQAHVEDGMVEKKEDDDLQRALALSLGGAGDASDETKLSLQSNRLVLEGKDARCIEPGYVFDVVVLPDLKIDSKCFALACARYNTCCISL